MSPVKLSYLENDRQFILSLQAHTPSVVFLYPDIILRMSVLVNTQYCITCYRNSSYLQFGIKVKAII